MDARARSEVLTGLTIGRLNMALRRAQLVFRLNECQELSECSRALVAQSEQICDRIVARRRARVAQSGGAAPP